MPSDDSLSSPLPLDVRLTLETEKYRLRPNPARAEELRSIVREHGFHHINKRIWPKLKCAVCVIGYSFRQFEMKFRATYWDPTIPIFPFAYGMSEHHRIAIPRTTDAYQFMPIPRSVYYEFIEVKDDDDNENDNESDQPPPPSLELGQLESTGSCSSPLWG